MPGNTLRQDVGGAGTDPGDQGLNGSSPMEGISKFPLLVWCHTVTSRILVGGGLSCADKETIVVMRDYVFEYGRKKVEKICFDS